MSNGRRPSSLKEAQGASLFDLGRTVATPAALDTADRNGIDVSRLILRHWRGDFGKIGKYQDATITPEIERDGIFGIPEDAPDHDLLMNRIAIDLEPDSRIMSVYEEQGATLWIITDRGEEPVTTVLLPSDY